MMKIIELIILGIIIYGMSREVEKEYSQKKLKDYTLGDIAVVFFVLILIVLFFRVLFSLK